MAKIMKTIEDERSAIQNESLSVDPILSDGYTYKNESTLRESVDDGIFRGNDSLGVADKESRVEELKEIIDANTGNKAHPSKTTHDSAKSDNDSQPEVTEIIEIIEVRECDCE